MKGEPGLSDLSALGGKQVDSNSDDFQNYFDEVSFGMLELTLFTSTTSYALN